MAREPFEVAGARVAPGSRERVLIPLPRLYNHADATMPVQVVHTRREGPVLFVCAAIHGDEINGVEVIRRLLKMRLLGSLRGTLVAIPIVNVYGFIATSRYSPDRRDLNRSFPGREKGSLTAQLAHVFATEVVANCTHGIDFHTGSNHRTNLPQLRVTLAQPGVRDLAEAFHAPIIVDSDSIEGSLRGHCNTLGIPLLVYEGGEPLRYDERVIQIGLRGVVNVMRRIGMLPQAKSAPHRYRPVVARESVWVRAPQSGILFRSKALGKAVREGEIIGSVADPYGEYVLDIEAPADGIIIGKSSLPLTHGGDACFHIAKPTSVDSHERLQRIMEGFPADAADPDPGPEPV